MIKEYLVRLLSNGLDTAEIKATLRTGSLNEARNFIENSEYEYYEIWERDLAKPITPYRQQEKVK